MSHVDAEPAKRGMRKVGRETDRIIVEALREVARDDLVPIARTLAPRHSGLLRRRITARAMLRSRRKGPAIRLMARTPYAGLLNFGGTVRGRIVPKNARSLMIAPGVFRASVSADRVYRAQGFLEAATEAVQPLATWKIREHVKDALQEALDGRP